MNRTLRDLAIGESGVVTAVKGSGVLRQHLLDMGLIPGTTVTVVKFAPMGDPIEIQIYGYERDSRAHRTPSFYRGENPRLRDFQQRAQSHTACQGREGQEKSTTGCQPMPISLHGYSRTTTSLHIFPCHGPPSALYEDIRPQDPTLSVEGGIHVALPT